MTYESYPANGYEQAHIHDSHVTALIYLIKKYFGGIVTITAEDLMEFDDRSDSLQIRVISPNTWTIGVGKRMEHERPGVSYLLSKEMGEPDAQTISEA